MEPHLFWKQVEELFDQALPLKNGERFAFVQGIQDAAVRSEVESLLSADEKGSDHPIEWAIGSAALSLSREGRSYGPYTTISLLGVGGMSEVYLARDDRLGRMVALKLLPLQSRQNEAQLRRFHREAQMASALNHPNILTMYDMGETSGEFYMATEHVEGISLHTYGEGQRVAVDDVLRIGEQVASALAAAHAAGIIHRDIKPTNIMLRPDGLVKILDFGLARIETGLGDAEKNHTALTLPGTLMGTPRYMSPEQARGLQTDARSDLWSAGAVFYELLAGEPAICGSETLDILIAVLQREPRPFSELGVIVPAGVQAMVFKLLAKDPAQRYASAAELLQDIRTLQAEQKKASERPPSSEVELQRHTPKRLAWPLLAALIVALLLSGVLVMRYFSNSRPPLAHPVITYSVTAQRPADDTFGPPLEIGPGTLLESGSRFRVNISARATGFFYLLGQDVSADGESRYTVLFPLPSINGGSAHVKSGQQLAAGWYRFGAAPGTEKLWLLWTNSPLPQLEALRSYLNADDKGSVTDPAQRAALSALLSRPELRANSVPERVDPKSQTLAAAGATAISLLEIAHS